MLPAAPAAPRAGGLRAGREFIDLIKHRINSWLWGVQLSTCREVYKLCIYIYIDIKKKKRKTHTQTTSERGQ